MQQEITILIKELKNILQFVKINRLNNEDMTSISRLTTYMVNTEFAIQDNNILNFHTIKKLCDMTNECVLLARKNHIALSFFKKRAITHSLAEIEKIKKSHHLEFKVEQSSRLEQKRIA